MCEKPYWDRQHHFTWDAGTLRAPRQDSVEAEHQSGDESTRMSAHQISPEKLFAGMSLRGSCSFV